MDAARDSRGNLYVEFDMTTEERIRVTRIEHAAWASGPTVRIQKRRKTGNVVQGPELPTSAVPDLIAALQDAAGLAADDV
jgi:hypothetical protein